MSGNSIIRLHRCFDVEKQERLSIKGKKKLFVRFPKDSCTCSRRVRVSERDAMLHDGSAVVVLRAGAEPSVDKSDWREIVVTNRVFPRARRDWTPQRSTKQEAGTLFREVKDFISRAVPPDLRDEFEKMPPTLGEIQALRGISARLRASGTWGESRSGRLDAGEQELTGEQTVRLLYSLRKHRGAKGKELVQLMINDLLKA